MKQISTYRMDHQVHIMPGDVLLCSVQDRKSMQAVEVKTEIKQQITVDTIIVFEVENLCGLKQGIGAVFGS